MQSVSIMNLCGKHNFNGYYYYTVQNRFSKMRLQQVIDLLHEQKFKAT